MRTLGDYRSAVQVWTQGVNASECGFGFGCCVETLMLLTVATVLEPEICWNAALPKVMGSRVSDPRVRG